MRRIVSIFALRSAAMSSESSGNLAILRYVFVPTMPLWGVMNKHGPEPALAEKIKDDDEIQRLTEIERITNGKPSNFDMDAAFCARMHAAIEAGLESAPTSVITTPGTKNPRYVLDQTARYHRSRNEW
jgi:hypothetical protein